MFTHVDEDKLLALFDEHAVKVAKEKIQRKTVYSKEPLSAMLYIIDDLSDSANLRVREDFLPKLFTTGNHQGACAWININALSAVSPLLRKNASMLLIFRISNAKEYEVLREEYAHLIGKEEFDEVYRRAVGKAAPAYSFLTILPHEQDESKMMLARWDQRLFVESDDEG